MNVLLVIHPTQFCNLNCSYCWAPNRASTDRISLDSIRLALEQVATASHVDRVDLCWLTGEPLVMGISHFSSVIDLYKKTVPPHAQGRFVVQTNGTLIDEEYAAFFSEHGFNVGVSIDGPKELHDAQRPAKNGRSSHDLALRGILLLRDAGVHGGALCVVTRRTLELGASNLFDFFEKHGIAWSYLIGASIGDNIGHVDNLTIVDAPLVKSFLSELLKLWASSESSYIRDFDQYSRRIYGEYEELDVNNLGCLDILNILPNGDFFGATRN